jgi:hypothetical protein
LKSPGRAGADFKTNTGQEFGVKLTRSAPVAGDLEAYFDPVVSMQGKIMFSKYVHEPLLQQARDVARLRHAGGQSRGSDPPDLP